AWTYTGSDPTSFATNTDREALSVNVTATDSLDTIAEKINSKNAGVQASVIKVDDKYQLTLTAPSGASNAMQISVDNPSLDGFSFTATNYSNVSETQKASDAKLTVNGLAVTRESNTIDDVISGLNFTINKITDDGVATTDDSLTFSVTADKSAAETAVRGFVAAYNAFQETTNKLVGYTRDADNNLVRGDLASDSSARSTINRMRSLIGGAVPGLESGFTVLTNVGIRTERDGSLSISESDPTQGKTFGSLITNANFDALAHELTAPVTIAAGSGYNFKINVDGVTSNSIDLAGTYNSIEELRAGLQSKINSDGALKAGGVGVDVGFDTTTNSFNFTSHDYGSASQAVFTVTSANMASLGIAPTQANIVGSAVTQSTFDPLTENFTIPLNAASGNYDFKVNLNGVESNSITLTGTYNTAEQLRVDLQTQINNDSKLLVAGLSLSVSYNTSTDNFSFISNTGGADSAVGFTATGTDMSKLGINSAMSGTRGVDVEGTVNGV
ncbi:flagellar filament capping protein FliD, partial [Chromatium okenii]|uniref:flagellar filament capping protein FliD n=1 Tax=Chromatium okenii TaxID=61644 RepID=UPI0026EEF541